MPQPAGLPSLLLSRQSVLGNGIRYQRKDRFLNGRHVDVQRREIRSQHSASIFNRFPAALLPGFGGRCGMNESVTAPG